MSNNKLRPAEGNPRRRQHPVDSSNINNPNGIRSRYILRYGDVNERQPINGQRVNGHPVNGHQNAFNHPFANNRHLVDGRPNEPSPATRMNGHVPSGGYRNFTGCQNGLFINKMVVRDELIKPRLSSDARSNSNDRTRELQPRAIDAKKNRAISDDRNNRLVNCQNAINGRLARKDCDVPTDLRQVLRPTVIQKPEIFKVDYDPEDINGPYNFRQLLRPAEYLPTESLRKRKGGLACNGVSVAKDKLPEKHVKRRAPSAPNQNKIVHGKK